MILVYQYGARPPQEKDVVLDHMREGHNYFNDVIAAEQQRRKDVEEIGKSDIVKAIEADVTLIKERLDAEKKAAALLRQHFGGLAHGIAAARSEALGNKQSLTEIRAREAVNKAQRARALGQSKASVDALDVELKEAYARLSVARKSEQTTRARAAMDAAMEEFYGACKKAYKARSGCFWGTKLIVKRAADAAIDASRKFLVGQPPPSPPRFRRWCGEGTVGVQIQDETKTASNFVLDYVGEPGTSRRSQLKRRGIAKIRIGSDEHRDPIWAHVPIIIHRPLPEDAIIRWVALHRRMTADHERWVLDITIEVPDRKPAPAPGTCGVDIGWRRVPDGIRVAMLANEHTTLDAVDSAVAVVVPNTLISRFEHADSLRSIRDRNMDVVRNTVATYFSSLPSVPEWATAAGVANLHQWKSPGRLVKFCRLWQRHDGDGFAWTALEAWRRQDRHLWQWECHEREGAVRHKRELFRLAAHDIVNRYGKVVIEDMDLRPLIAATPEQTLEERAAARLRQIASPGEFRATLLHAAKMFGARVIGVNPANTTRCCHGCGHVNNFANQWVLEQVCTNCGRRWDQDVNAGLNLRASASEVKEEATAETAPTGGRYQRLKAEKAKRSKEAAQVAVFAT